MTDRPNYFIILGIDPEERWNQATFERVLNEKRALWSRQRQGVKTHPTTVEAQRNLALVRDIERIMQQPGSRDQERTAARHLQKDEFQRRMRRFVERVDVILDKGFLYDVEWEMLRAETDLLHSDPKLRLKLERAEKRPFQQARADDERLDGNTERNLRQNLAIVSLPNLYAVLATVDSRIKENSPREQLLSAAEGLYRKARNTADKTRPEVGAMQVLSGIAKVVFGSDDIRRRHNFSMLLAPLEAILEQYEETLKPVRAVDARQFESFLRKAAEKGIDPALARELFAAHFRELNWAVDLPSATAEASLKRLKPCPYCEVLNDPDAKSCTNCARRLSEPCPYCGAKVSAWAGACPKCGFRVALRGEVEYLLEEAESRLGRHDLPEAADVIRRAEQIWNLGPGRRDELAGRTAAARERLNAQENEQRKARKRVTDLMGQQKYREALRVLHEQPWRWPDAGDLISECRDQVMQADRLCRQAEAGGITSARKAEFYLQALRVCTDYAHARDELVKIPPAPPQGFAVHLDMEKRVVRLTWDQLDPGYSAVAIRAEGLTPPRSAAAGSGQGRYPVGSASSWEDTEPPIGRPVHYAVFAKRDLTDTMSAQPAVTRTPIFLTAESQLTIKAGNRSVELSWTLPANATGVEILRDEPASPGRSARLEPVRPGSGRLVDRDVRNGTRYRYSVYTLFAEPGQVGVFRRSTGIVRDVTPIMPPAPPRHLYARGYPPRPGMEIYLHRVQLCWPEPDAGAVKVVKLDAGPALRAGDEFPEHDLDRHGLVLAGPQPLRDTWFMGLDPCVYIPVLVLDGHCYVGEARRYAPGPEVRDLRAEHLGVVARLTWMWPSGVGEALVGWDSRAAPPDPVAARQQARVRRSGNEPLGRYDVPAEAAGFLYVLVAAIIHGDKGEFVTSGVATSVSRPSIRLRYEVRRPRMRGSRRLEIVLRPERLSWLPALEVHGRSDSRRASRDDPLLMRIAAGPAPQEPLRIPAETSAEPQSCALYLADEADADWVVIMD